jgi:amino acid transporter
MADFDDKSKFASGADIDVSTVKKRQPAYDPMQETRMTRLGLSWESFKRAPGSTGGQIVHGREHMDPEQMDDSTQYL